MQVKTELRVAIVILLVSRLISRSIYHCNFDFTSSHILLNSPKAVPILPTTGVSSSLKQSNNDEDDDDDYDNEGDDEEDNENDDEDDMNHPARRMRHYSCGCYSF